MQQRVERQQNKTEPLSTIRVVGSSSRALSADARVLGLSARPESTCSTVHCVSPWCSRRMVGSPQSADEGRAATAACQQHEPCIGRGKHRRRSAHTSTSKLMGSAACVVFNTRHRQMRIVLHVQPRRSSRSLSLVQYANRSKAFAASRSWGLSASALRSSSAPRSIWPSRQRVSPRSRCSVLSIQ